MINVQESVCRAERNSDRSRAHDPAADLLGNIKMYNRCPESRTTDNRAYGFTLIELLVVIGIIVLLVSIILPSFNKVRDQARTASCLNNLRQIGVAFESYRAANDGFMPPSYMSDLGVQVNAPYSRWVYKFGPL